MKPLLSFVKTAIRQVNPITSKFITSLSQFSAYIDLPQTRVILFLGITAYIASKTFLSINNNWRSFEGLLILVLGFGLIFRSNDKWGDIAALGVILFLMLSPLNWRFQGYDTDGFTIGGVLPTSDAVEYFTGATKILYGENVSIWAARRPLFETFLSFILFIFRQDLVAVLLCMAVIVAIAAFLLALEIRAGFGTFPAALTTMVLVYCYTGRFAGKFLTEQIGIPLGALSLALLVRGLRVENFRLITFGVFMLSLAQNTRPGALFVLPMLILWGAFWKTNTKFTFKPFIGLSAAVALGFLLTYWTFTYVAGPGSVPFGNFGSTIYGMATGYRGWRVWYAEYPGVVDTEAMKIAMQIILESPSVFMSAIAQAFRDFLNPQYFFSFLYLPKNSSLPASFTLTVLTIAGLWRILLSLWNPFSRMMVSVFAGILVSIPFAPPPDDGIRAMTATIGFLALIAGCAVVNLKRAPGNQREYIVQSGLDKTLYFSFTLTLFIILGWVLVRGSLTVPGQGISCNPSERAVTVVLSPSSHINIRRNSESHSSYLPNIRREDMLDNLSNFPSSYLWEAFRRISPDHTIILGVNFLDNRQASEPMWLAVPTSAIQDFNGVNYFCARETGNPELDNVHFLIERNVENVFTSP